MLFSSNPLVSEEFYRISGVRAPQNVLTIDMNEILDTALGDDSVLILKIFIMGLVIVIMRHCIYLVFIVSPPLHKYGDTFF